MEKVKRKKASRKRSADFGLRILALIIAVIIWLILSITEYPTINKTITKLPVTFSLDGTAAEERGLQALGYQDITVDVEIKGMNYEIGSYTANDLVASVNLDSVTKEGTYSLDIDVKSTHSSDRVTVVSVSPDTVDVTFVHISSGVFTVTPSAPNISAEQGKTLRDITVSPSEINIEGSDSELKKISRVDAVIANTQVLSEETAITTEELAFFDADGNMLDSTKYKVLDAKSFEVSFDVYKKKTVDLTVDFTDLPPGFRVASLPYELSETQINVITPLLDDPDTQTVSLATVSLNDVNANYSAELDVNSRLGTGEINQSGIDTVMLTFDFDGADYTSKVFTVPASSIQLQNAPAGKTVTVETKQLNSITMFGPRNIMNTLTLGDIAAVIDLADTSSTGSMSREVMIYAPGYDSVWCLGEQTVQIEIAEKQQDESSQTSSQEQ